MFDYAAAVFFFFSLWTNVNVSPVPDEGKGGRFTKGWPPYSAIRCDGTWSSFAPDSGRRVGADIKHIRRLVGLGTAQPHTLK